ncbi:MAG: gluconeogenesis factor YvcK family protein [Prochlorothrix sp.]|nr:gluconeogenesis factor YvcK family protein [Prochlorothrix sp.]
MDHSRRSLSLPKQQSKRRLRRKRRRTLSPQGQRVGQWVKWLVPGLFVKRWLLMSAVGVVMTVLGLAIWANLSPVHYIIRFIRSFLEQITQLFPNYVSGPVVLLLGLLFVFWGQSRTLGSITEVLMPEPEEELVDLLLTHRRLHRGPRIVAIGGGTGLSNLLRGLKHYSANITAIVTVADDGGSSGRLRREMGVQPPGDIRNCLTALAQEEKLLTELFHYRFETGDGLMGHSFGNLFLTAMTAITGGDFERAIAASSHVLAVRGKVLPATLSDMKIWADFADGRRVEGESNIPEAQGQIIHLGCDPPNPPALPSAIRAIQEADYIIIGPGSLYTSILPNFLVPELAAAVAQATAPRVYVCNVMTQPGETTGYTVADHIEAIDQAWGTPLFDAVVVQKRPPSQDIQQAYAAENSTAVDFDREAVLQLGRQIVLAHVMIEDFAKKQVRHDPQRLARVLMQWYKQVS